MNQAANLQQSLQTAFWRWFSVAAVALLIAAALPAFAADVFIDEGDSDFNPAAEGSIPVRTAASDSPASEMSPPIDAEILNEPSDAAPVAEAAPGSATTRYEGVQPFEPKAVKKSEKKAKKTAKKDKAGKKLAKAKSDKKKSAMKGKARKKVAATAKSGKSKKVAKHSKKNQRKVASVRYAGGQYATTKSDCMMESAPGAGDAIGQAKASRKLWVEDAGSGSYWKVYNKSGQPAFVSRSCF